MFGPGDAGKSLETLHFEGLSASTHIINQLNRMSANSLNVNQFDHLCGEFEEQASQRLPMRKALRNSWSRTATYSSRVGDILSENHEEPGELF